MESNKSLDEVTLIAALLHDFQKSHEVVFNKRALNLTCKKIRNRVLSEGRGFLTKSLPRLGKAFDKALHNHTPLSAIKLGFKPMPGSELPMLMGEFFSRVLSRDGTVLQDPCARSVYIIRQIAYLFYKYELPYDDKQEQQVIEKFKKTDDDLIALRPFLRSHATMADNRQQKHHNRPFKVYDSVDVVCRARNLLARLFSRFDPRDVVPRHGPGAVSTKEKLWGKYQWLNVSPRISHVYPIDEYFYSSLSHVCDRMDQLKKLSSHESAAKVILVPKDSRGPRLISCEPVDFQWVQQGLGRAIVQLVEKHPLTKWNVFFTDQAPNQRGALLGSTSGKYATIDLNEASDRVSLDLVSLLFPPHVYEFLENCRSLSTTLPSGENKTLNKFAPMGSALCFPVLALTVWAILSAGCRDADTLSGILVYGDDVVVPTTYVAEATKLLEAFGLKINQDKSCTAGLFRESCGMDAFNGVVVTPVRIRTPWSSTQSPESLSSWVAYANSFWERKCFITYDYIVGQLVRMYGPLPGKELRLGCPSLYEPPVNQGSIRSRINTDLQKREYYVWTVRSPVVIKEIDGWSMLLRYFTEGCKSSSELEVKEFKRLDLFLGTSTHVDDLDDILAQEIEPFTVSLYTKRRASMLARRWR